ncbi:hypothetical protein NPIL_317721 [Nephila pilipes]|uniref:Pre-C2HC domain-containing protein n=1 Tax=Nephila pilipes TaxID=299642 RepID=A0A8X6N8W3_NEPPI|nr:hypothetical protein NPIL_277451 [Nephila pilipes]GFT79623.1 hypothetical protein NPIL_317721 [Nephila pilipes]
MPPEEIMDELVELGFQPQSCHAMTNRKTNLPMPLFLTTLTKNNINKDIYNITELCSLKIEIESFPTTKSSFSPTPLTSLPSTSKRIPSQSPYAPFTDLQKSETQT